MRTLLAVVLVAVAACREKPPKRYGSPEPRFPPSIEMGPQLAYAASDGMTVAWRTFEAVAGAVECDGRVIDGGAATREHVVRVTGLKAGTTYPYRLRHDGAQVPGEYRLTTVSDAPFRFAVVGDSGSGCAMQFAVARVIADGAPDLVLHVGDLAYPTATRETMVLRHFIPFAELLARVPFYSVHGDHELHHENGAVVRDLLYLPGNERYYSFDRGGCHFVALDSNLPLTPGSEQRAWLETDLQAAAGARWRVVVVHHPPYSSSPKHGSVPRVRALCGLFERHGVHLVLSGNDHVYERSFPLRDDRVVKDGGTVYVVTGGGGQVLYRVRSSYFTATSRSAHHAVFVDVTADTLTLRALDQTGKEIDRFTRNR